MLTRSVAVVIYLSQSLNASLALWPWYFRHSRTYDTIILPHYHIGFNAHFMQTVPVVCLFWTKGDQLQKLELCLWRCGTFLVTNTLICWNAVETAAVNSLSACRAEYLQAPSTIKACCTLIKNRHLSNELCNILSTKRWHQNRVKKRMTEWSQSSTALHKCDEFQR